MTTLVGVTHRHPEILSGIPVFVGTRVPVRSLFDYLEGATPWKSFFISFLPSNANKPLPCLMRLTNRSRQMRILLDENFPVDFAKLLVGQEVATVHSLGWSGIKAVGWVEERNPAFRSPDALGFRKASSQLRVGKAKRNPPNWALHRSLLRKPGDYSLK